MPQVDPASMESLVLSPPTNCSLSVWLLTVALVASFELHLMVQASLSVCRIPAAHPRLIQDERGAQEV